MSNKSIKRSTEKGYLLVSEAHFLVMYSAIFMMAEMLANLGNRNPQDVVIKYMKFAIRNLMQLSPKEVENTVEEAVDAVNTVIGDDED